MMKSENFHFNRVAEQCRDELHKLRAKMDWPAYKRLSINIAVVSEEDKDKFEIQFDAGYGDVRVTGSSIGTVMDEVYRRLDFHDRETARIDSSMRHLAPPPDAPLPGSPPPIGNVNVADDRHNLDGVTLNPDNNTTV
jgi:hypothetical protein